MPTDTITLALTPEELRLLWLGTETLAECNPDDPDAISLDRKVTEAITTMEDKERKSR